MMTNERSQEQRAAEELMRTAHQQLDGKRAIEIAVAGSVQAAMTNAALQGLIELLVHKNVIAQHDLGPALRHAYNRANDKLLHGTSTGSSLILPDPVISRPQ